MNDFMQRAMTEPFTRFYEGIIAFLPRFLTALLIVVAGLVTAGVLKAAFSRFLRVLGVDGLSERSGIAGIMRKSGITETLSVMLAKAAGWITVVTFMIIALDALNIPAVERLLERFLLYLPQVFVASIILFFGFILGNFLGRAALIAAVNAGSKVSTLIGRFVKFTVFILSSTIALEQLGIGKETVLIAFAVIFGGTVLAFALAFGLGGKEIAREYLERKFKGEEDKEDDIRHL